MNVLSYTVTENFVFQIKVDIFRYFAETFSQNPYNVKLLLIEWQWSLCTRVSHFQTESPLHFNSTAKSLIVNLNYATNKIYILRRAKLNKKKGGKYGEITFISLLLFWKLIPLLERSFFFLARGPFFFMLLPQKINKLYVDINNVYGLN